MTFIQLLEFLKGSNVLFFIGVMLNIVALSIYAARVRKRIAK